MYCLFVLLNFAWMYHNLFMHLLPDGHLGLFQVFGGYIYNALLLCIIPRWKLPKKTKFVSVNSLLWAHMVISNSNPTQFKAVVFSHLLSSFFSLCLCPPSYIKIPCSEAQDMVQYLHWTSPSQCKKEKSNWNRWGWCTRKRACLMLLYVQSTGPGLFLFSRDCVCFWTTISTSLSSSLLSTPTKSLLSKGTETEVVRALLEYDVYSSTYKKFDF